MEKTIEIYKILTLNDYINAERSNKYKAAKLKKEYTDFFAREFIGEKITKPVDIHFIWHLKNKRRDIDNIAFMQKFILDGMVKAGTLKDDNMQWVQGLKHDLIINRKLKLEKVTVKTI